MKISVLTPTIRPERLEIVANSLAAQTFQSYEWIVCSPHYPHEETDQLPSIKKIPLFQWFRDDFKGGFWSLARAYNKMIKAAKGELIVSIQDSIWFPDTALEQFWLAHEEHPEALISGVGDQYTQTDAHGMPYLKVWNDPRIRDDLGSFYECNWPDIEYNYCAIPKKAIEEIGGWDEQMDFLGYTPDGGYQMNERFNDAGKRFWLDQTNVSKTLRHDRSVYGGDKKWNDNLTWKDDKYQKRREELKKLGQWPRLTNSKKLDAI